MTEQNRTERRLGIAHPALQHPQVKATVSPGVRLHNTGVAASVAAGRYGLANGNERTRARFEEALRHQMAGRLAEAEACYRDVLRRAPEHADTLNNLGQVLLNRGAIDMARSMFRNAVARRFNFPEAHCNLGIANKLTGQVDRAEADFQRALSFRPDFAEALYHLGSLMGVRGRYGQAAEHLMRALELAGEFPLALVDLGIALYKTGRLVEAEAALSRALTLAPGNVEAKYTLALVRLSCGRFSEAWADFERRRELEHPPYPTNICEWQGEPLAGKRILLVGERSVEDQLQFVRYTGELADRGAIVEVWTIFELAGVLGAAKGVARVWTEPPVTRFDYWSFLLSVPARLGAGAATIPSRPPYVLIPPFKVAAAKDLVHAYAQGRFKVAVACAGAAGDQSAVAADISKVRCIDTFVDQIAWIPLANVGTRAISEEAPEYSFPKPFWLDMTDLLDVAAVISATDLFLCTDPMLAHIAGSLGHPTWLFLPDKFDWRWSAQIEGVSTWYPCVRCLDWKMGDPNTGDFSARLAGELEAHFQSGCGHFQHSRGDDSINEVPPLRGAC